ncbi:MAG TPA: aspartyl/asparaginyl beta-hydroxylase domain-containing protein [Thermoanaerobaculia bacterium]|nr:aspartyl/asparaginyl beta-hydroxylase domain-containing protein [Thermoanaerobaculia bacterium]
MKPARGALERTVRAAGDWIERQVARASVFGDPCVYDPRLFPWTSGLEAEWRAIRGELDRVMEFREDLPSFQDVLPAVRAITADPLWKTYFLMGIGMDCVENARRCPQTMRLLRTIPGVKTAFFSILSPGKHIPPHRGAYNGILRLHLPLLVPEPRESCWIRIGAEVHHWTEGRCLIFDDTFNHEVRNDTSGYRVVLFVDFARPLKSPFHRINETFLNMAAFAPFLREAGARQRTWEEAFYRGEVRKGLPVD